MPDKPNRTPGWTPGPAPGAQRDAAGLRANGWGRPWGQCTGMVARRNERREAPPGLFRGRQPAAASRATASVRQHGSGLVLHRGQRGAPPHRAATRPASGLGKGALVKAGPLGPLGRRSPRPGVTSLPTSWPAEGLRRTAHGLEENDGPRARSTLVVGGPPRCHGQQGRCVGDAARARRESLQGLDAWAGISNASHACVQQLGTTHARVSACTRICLAQLGCSSPHQLLGPCTAACCGPVFRGGSRAQLQPHGPLETAAGHPTYHRHHPRGLHRTPCRPTMASRSPCGRPPRHHAPVQRLHWGHHLPLCEWTQQVGTKPELWMGQVDDSRGERCMDGVHSTGPTPESFCSPSYLHLLPCFCVIPVRMKRVMRAAHAALRCCHNLDLS